MKKLYFLFAIACKGTFAQNFEEKFKEKLFEAQAGLHLIDDKERFDIFSKGYVDDAQESLEIFTACQRKYTPTCDKYIEEFIKHQLLKTMGYAQGNFWQLPARLHRKALRAAMNEVVTEQQLEDLNINKEIKQSEWLMFRQNFRFRWHLGFKGNLVLSFLLNTNNGHSK